MCSHFPEQAITVITTTFCLHDLTRLTKDISGISPRWLFTKELPTVLQICTENDSLKKVTVLTDQIIRLRKLNGFGPITTYSAFTKSCAFVLSTFPDFACRVDYGQSYMTKRTLIGPLQSTLIPTFRANMFTNLNHPVSTFVMVETLVASNSVNENLFKFLLLGW